jgi:colanic acid/amylovoran biosynthesis glycosyltransferase
MNGPRPPVSVIVPFLGDERAAASTLSNLEALVLRSGDELIVADNTRNQVMTRGAAGTRFRTVRADGERSSYHARNVAAEQAANDWVLFIDADCRPVPDLLDQYFAEPIDATWAALAGAIVAPPQPGAVARWGRARGRLNTGVLLRHFYRPLAITANLLVRRVAWEAVGGFHEGIRSGGDADFSWRLQEEGWLIAPRPPAVVEHAHPERLRALLRKAGRYAGGHSWLNRRHPDSHPRPRLGERLPRHVGGMLRAALGRRFDDAALAAIDTAVLLAENTGYLLGNTAPKPPPPPPAPGALSVCVLCERFPALSETFVGAEARELGRLGHRVRLEATARPRRPQLGGARGLHVSYREDDALLRKALDLAWLCLRHPLRCARDLLARRRFAREEEVPRLRALAPAARRLARLSDRHLHAHFADGAALTALRLSRLLAVPYSVTAHAYDIYKAPKNLRQKLLGAAFITSGCDYTVRDLRALCPERGDRIHRLVMGVDPARFRRGGPPPGGRTVLAVGRLVEKKGFSHLLEAAARLHREDGLERVLIVGEGELRGELEAQIERLGLGDTASLLGALEPERVRELYERADLFCMPCVIAPDGDRDSMPVVVKEALAMELPVVASDEVGLPELVRAEWGRLVPPADPEALAAAISELFSLPPAERAEMGRRGRAFVERHCSLEGETERLVGLVQALSAD